MILTLSPCHFTRVSHVCVFTQTYYTAEGLALRPPNGTHSGPRDAEDGPTDAWGTSCCNYSGHDCLAPLQRSVHHHVLSGGPRIISRVLNPVLEGKAACSCVKWRWQGLFLRFFFSPDKEILLVFPVSILLPTLLSSACGTGPLPLQMLPLDNWGGCKQQGGTQLKSLDQALCHGKCSQPSCPKCSN